MRILDDPEEIAERIEHGGDLMPPPTSWTPRCSRAAELQETGIRGLGVRHSPVGRRSAGAGGAVRRIRIQTQLVAADVEADVEGLIEIGRDPEHRAVPGLGPVEVRDTVDHRPQAENRSRRHLIFLLWFVPEPYVMVTPAPRDFLAPGRRQRIELKSPHGVASIVCHFWVLLSAVRGGRPRASGLGLGSARPPGRRLAADSADEGSLDIVHGGGFRLASLRIPGVRGLGRTDLQAAVTGAYRRLETALHGLHPVRWWNHIPGIHDPIGDGQDLYMVFNAGRYEALAAWLGKESFDTRVASASGVGHEGRDLVIHCLASDRPGRAVDNPRQIAPYRYSRRYGRLPPCFARATVIQPSTRNPLVLVGGTASIVGEASVHLGDLRRQTEETLVNLAVLLRAACGDPATEVADRAGVLAGFRELRVYDPVPERRDELRALLRTPSRAFARSNGCAPISAAASCWWRSKGWPSSTYEQRPGFAGPNSRSNRATRSGRLMRVHASRAAPM